jgi:hypothetical protein
LTFLHTLFDGRDGVDGLGLASGIGICPDGEYVYVAAETDNAIGIFKRSMEAKPPAIVAHKFVTPKENLQIPEELQACAANSGFYLQGFISGARYEHTTFPL